MKIELSPGVALNTDTPKDLVKFKKLLPGLSEEERLAVQKQIEQSTPVSYDAILFYREISPMTVCDFSGRYFKATELESATRDYIFLSNKFYLLPKAELQADLVYALIDKLLYENQRNNWGDSPCTTLRKAIQRFLPKTFSKSRAYFAELLKTREAATHTYFGDCPSDDSDSDYEREFLGLKAPVFMAKLDEANKLRGWASSDKYYNRMTGNSSPPTPVLALRAQIVRDLSGKEESQASKDLKAINLRIEKGGALTPAFLDSLTTRFAVAQYRGIHYLTTQWDKVARGQHRSQDELNKAQFSSAVFNLCEVTSYHESLDKGDDADFQAELVETAQEVERLLLLMQHAEPVSCDGFAYQSLFYLLQHWYSSSYDKYTDKVQRQLNKVNSLFSQYLQTAERPFVSTSDVPYHALKYAYGIKLYAGHEPERLFPRWHKDGQAERPHSGKVYMSLHPLNDYTEHNPSHLTSLFMHGLTKLSNVIAPERETSFLGYLPEDRVKVQHVAKYPSFTKKQAPISYQTKYGIDSSMYNKIRTGFQSFAPNSKERECLELVLGEYLCAYQEQRLIEDARKYAKDKMGGAVLVYRNANGGFSLEAPQTPTTAATAVRRVVNSRRELYTALAPNKSTVVKTISRKHIEKSLTTQGAAASVRTRVLSNFFEAKQKPDTAVADEAPMRLRFA